MRASRLGLSSVGDTMRLYLTGFMGSGKSTVGKRLAELLEWQFLDLDAAVVDLAGLTVPEIFSQQGEAAFRRLEREALEETLLRDGLVVATGGGTLTVKANRELLVGRGVTVWLNPPFSTIMRRIGRGADRPLFRDGAQASELFRSRLEAYGSSSYRIDIDGDEAPDQVAGRIVVRLRQQECGI